jgi:hypothetical protein
MTWSPRPVSASRPGCFGTGAPRPGSATAHSTLGPGCNRPSRIGDRGHVSPDSGSACRSALVSSSDTTIAISSQRCAMPHRSTVATAKSRAARTDRASTPGVRVATRGKHVQLMGWGSGDNGQLPLATAAISTTGASQWPSVPSARLPARHEGCPVIAVRSATPPGTAHNGILPHARGHCKRLLHGSVA